MVSIAGAVAALYVGFLALLFFSQRSMLYPGAKNRVDPEPPAAPGMEVWRLSTPTATVEALFLPAGSPSAATRPEPVVIFAHGNGEVIDYWVDNLDGFRRRGIGVLLVEYPGYGRSTGAPSEAGIRAAMSAAYDRVAADARVDRTRILGFGQSLGGGAICLLAKERPLRALILESTFPSLAIFASRYGAPAFLLRDRFDNAATLAHFTGPVLVIHGRQDDLIPWQHGARLAAAATHGTFRLYECGHGCWDPEHLPFWHDVDPFLASAGILPPPAASGAAPAFGPEPATGAAPEPAPEPAPGAAAGAALKLR